MPIDPPTAPDAALVGRLLGDGIVVDWTQRIGVGFGLAGLLHRVHITTANGTSRTIVVKQGRADAAGRASAFHRDVEERVAGDVPALLAADVPSGVLVFEDVAPAVQGDVLAGCDDEQAGAVLDVLARVHGASWDIRADPETPVWDPRARRQGGWADRLALGVERYPDLIGPFADRLAVLGRRRFDLVATLKRGPQCWIHGDAHLDNVLWRRDGSAVVLDWDNAGIGPPSLDLAHALMEGIAATGRRKERLIERYAAGLTAAGGEPGPVIDLLEPATGLIVAAAIGWAGRPDDGRTVGRLELLRRNLIESSLRTWHPEPGT